MSNERIPEPPSRAAVEALDAQEAEDRKAKATLLLEALSVFVEPELQAGEADLVKRYLKENLDAPWVLAYEGQGEASCCKIEAVQRLGRGGIPHVWVAFAVFDERVGHWFEADEVFIPLK